MLTLDTKRAVSMDSYPKPARALVTQMTQAAAADPKRALALQGAPGCNGHRAALEYDSESLPLPCFAFEDALDAVKDGTAARAIIPIENSQNGRVADIHFLLPESGLSIVGEHFMTIHHALMVLPNAKDDALKVAFSHPQALGQSRHYLRERGLVPMSYADTAGAAAFVQEQGDCGAAAVAPALAAELYGLRIVEQNIEDAADNMTRFVVLSREALDPTTLGDGPTMTTFIFEVKNIPAALYKSLGGFATNGVNMTKLESYQVGASFAATTFYADIEGAPGDPRVDRAMEELAFHCKYVRLLGSYSQGRPRG